MPSDKCGACQHKPNDFWQCSRVECPSRKPVTAQPPEGAGDGPTPFRNPDNH